MRNRVFSVFLIFSLAIFAAGCGQKGPLYMPEEPANNRSTPEKEGQ